MCFRFLSIWLVVVLLIFSVQPERLSEATSASLSLRVRGGVQTAATRYAVTHGGAGGRGSDTRTNQSKRSATRSNSETSLRSLPTLCQSLSIQQKLIAGGVSRAISQCMLYPVDALRTLAQTRDHRSLADVGAAALVRGCVQTSCFAAFIGSIQFGLFGATRSVCGPVLASALGAAGSCIVSVPQEVIKQRLVTGVYSGFRDACTTIYKTEGIRGFYSSWQPTVPRNVPFVIATFTANDFMKHLIIERRRQKCIDSTNELTVRENLIVGISSAIVGAILTHPADVVKTQLMTQAASDQIPYSSVADCIGTMLNNEGLLAFYSGFFQRSLYMGPLWSLQFAMNGLLCKSFEKRNTYREKA